MEDKELNINIEKDESEEPVPTEIIYAEPILLDSDYVECQFDLNNFQKGIDDFSYYSGAYSALVSSGMSNIDAMNLIMTKINVDMNIKLTEINSQASVESAKYQSELVDKSTL